MTVYETFTVNGKTFSSRKEAEEYEMDRDQRIKEATEVLRGCATYSWKYEAKDLAILIERNPREYAQAVRIIRGYDKKKK